MNSQKKKKEEETERKDKKFSIVSRSFKMMPVMN